MRVCDLLVAVYMVCQLNFDLLQNAGMDMIGRWIASRHSHVAESSKGPASTPAPTIASSLKDGAVDKAWHDSGAGQWQRMPTHDLELSRSGEILQNLMRTYNIIGVRKD